jgi:NAD-dependent SIR2 family protein deacetylase
MAGTAAPMEAGTDPAAVERLAALLADGGVVVLSGAGISTESGIPDYRGPTGRRRGGRPMTYQQFVGDPANRVRYWARSHVGWRSVAGAHPNRGHRAVADLERAGVVTRVVTQNVDRLHTAAGSRDVVDLHGRLDRVVCLACGAWLPRREVGERLAAANPGFDAYAAPVRPDGDADLDPSRLAEFRVVDCPVCAGVLKPDVVFFGESVPRDRVQRAARLVEECRTLLVLGSSLSVMSGYRFVIAARRCGTPVAIVNQGPTRGDGDATVRLDAPLGVALPALRDLLDGGHSAPAGTA